MKRASCLAGVLLFSFLLASASSGGRRGSGDISFPQTITAKIGERDTKLVRTGSAVRHRGRIRVYAIASYVKAGATGRSAEELMKADVPKQLQLVMLRFVPAQTMADAFRAALRRNHPDPAFADEIRTVTDLFRKSSPERGERISLTHVPKVGLKIHRDNGDILIRNIDFSRAIWEIYLGQKNVEEGVRQGLISGLSGLAP